MKKLLIIASVALFAAAVLSPSAFAECAGHKAKGTKTAEGAATKTTKA